MFMYIVTIISFLLDLFLSSIIPITNTSYNFLIPMFTICSIVLMYPYFNKDRRSEFFRYVIIIGFIYDIVVTNTLFVNVIIFSCLGFIIEFLDGGLSNNLFSILFKCLIVMILYDIIMYFILALIGYINFSIFAIIFKVLKSIVLNVIYVIICYNVTEFMAKKLRIKKLV